MTDEETMKRMLRELRRDIYLESCEFEMSLAMGEFDPADPIFIRAAYAESFRYEPHR